MKKFYSLSLLLLWVLSLMPLSFSSASVFAQDPHKISPHLLEGTANEEITEFFLVLNEQADLSTAYTLPNKEAKGRYVYQQLRQVAERTQAPLKIWLKDQNSLYSSRYLHP